MNNCYGKTQDMQMPLVRVFPDIGDLFYIKCCVTDTDNLEAINKEVEQWIDYNMFNISHYELVFGVQNRINNLHLSFKSDMDGNEFEVYLPDEFTETENSSISDWVADYFTDANYNVV